MTRRANAYVVAALLTAGSCDGPARDQPCQLRRLGHRRRRRRSEHLIAPHRSIADATAQPGNVTVSSTVNGITISTRASAMLLQGHCQLSGTVPSSAPGSIVEIERLGRETGWAWAPTAHGTAGADGSFTAFWPANHIGRFQIRAVIEGPRRHQRPRGDAILAGHVIVYRPSIATWYGPGDYGRKTACGVTLTKATLGVANRTLRCGMPVAVYYHGRTMVVPVIDRGPYANHADWDLTAAAAQALGTYTAGVATIGAVSLPSK